jgi:hypothetical protein
MIAIIKQKQLRLPISIVQTTTYLQVRGIGASP